MRQLKFRAWLKELEEMVQYDQIIAPFIIEPIDSVSGKLRFKKLFQYYTCKSHTTWEHEHFEDVILMQYTGLKEIYEGDIIIAHEYGANFPLKYVVIFHPELLGFRMIWLDKYIAKDYSGSFRLSDNGFKRFEVIGNIHENPELL